MQARKLGISCISAVIPLPSLWHSKEYSLNVPTVTGICQAPAECQACSVMPRMQQWAPGSLSITALRGGPVLPCRLVPAVPEEETALAREREIVFSGHGVLRGSSLHTTATAWPEANHFLHLHLPTSSAQIASSVD